MGLLSGVAFVGRGLGFGGGGCRVRLLSRSPNFENVMLKLERDKLVFNGLKKSFCGHFNYTLLDHILLDQMVRIK